jgi:hypothetical protein
MNTKRFILGIISSALFAVGLTRAADRLDPLSRSVPAIQAVTTKSAPDTGTSTWVVIKPAPDTGTSTWVDIKGN